MSLYEKSASFRNHSVIWYVYASGENIIDEPVLASFDSSVTELSFNRLEAISRRESAFTLTDDAAARSSFGLISGGPLTLILPALISSFSALRNWLRSVPTWQETSLVAGVFEMFCVQQDALSLWLMKYQGNSILQWL